MLKMLLRVFAAIQAVMALLFVAVALILTAIAARTGWEAVTTSFDAEGAQTIVEAIGLLAAAVVALQIGQTIAEEEVAREAHVSAPTRVRRFLSRFLVVLVVALVIEGLVAAFRAVHEEPEQLLYVGMLELGTAALLAAWGAFIWFNRSAEELEPEAMRDAKAEDEKFE